MFCVWMLRNCRKSIFRCFSQKAKRRINGDCYTETMNLEKFEKKANRLKKRKSSVGDRWRRHRRSALSETAIEEAEFIDVSGDDGRHG